jgi:pilus assembly protein CpaD
MLQQPHRTYRRIALVPVLAGACAAALLVSAVPGAARKIERGVETPHQPVVERSDYIFDVPAAASGGLDPASGRQLTAWLDALGLRYGDRVTLAGVKGYDLAALRTGISEIVARYGLLPEGEAPLTVGEPPAGALRVVISRSTASVPDCPSWRDRYQSDFVGGLGDNYGCAMAGNLAAMVANPQDLVRGRATDSDLRTATSNRAIQAYREKAPSGAGGLQAMSAGGQ